MNIPNLIPSKRLRIFSIILLGVIFITTPGIVMGQAQSVRITGTNLTLRKAFDQIEKQTNLSLDYDAKYINENDVLKKLPKGNTLQEVLTELLEGTNCSFVIKGTHVVIANKQTARKNGKITGIVVDEKGQSVIGASITIKGTSKGTITDINGQFELEAQGNETLKISYIGFQPKDVAINNKKELKISLIEDSKSLDELVVVGYGVQKKSDVTGAMIRVSEKELKSRPVSNAIEAMQGKAAGVDITSNERPGEIGSINIRGVRSINASNSPLYVVDGIPLMSSSGIETLNPTDIESIEVLKDASATAIYGSRGANGVIIVSTKTGKQGKLSFNYSGSVTTESLQDRTKRMDADEYITWRRWAYYYADPNKYPRGDQPTQANDKQIFLGANDASAWNNIMKGWTSGTWDGSKVATTDWTDMVTQTGITTDHNISASGGTDKIKAYGSFGYLNNRGTMKGQDYERYTSKVSVDLNPVKWFQMGATINTTYSVQEYGQSTTGGQVSGPGSIYAAALGCFPYAVPYDQAGNRITYPGGDDMVKTIVNEWNYSQDQRTMFRALGSFYSQFSILPGLKYRINFGPDFRYYKDGIYIDAQSVLRNGAPNFASLRNVNDFSWTLDNLLYYDKKIKKHSIGATLLQSASKWENTYSYLQAVSIPIPSQKWNALNTTNIPSTNLKAWDSGITDRQLLSYMGRLNYGFDDKYLLTVSGRWDGASQLAPGHQWSFFPSAALGWRMEQESWMKPLQWINQLKLRLGMGTTGNSAIEPYSTKGSIVPLYYPYGNTLIAGYSPSETLVSGGDIAMANKKLGWEKTTQYNLGLDFSVLNGRISGVIDVYKSSTKDLLLKMSLPSITGYTNSWANIGETKNKGFDITINTVNLKTRNFTWESNLNAAYQKEEIVSLANGKSDDISNVWFIGQSIGVIYGYASNGIWKESDAAEMAKFNANGHSFQVGMARPADLNSDYKIDPNHDRKIIGNTRPNWTLGLTNTFTYKSLELSCFIYGRMGYTYNTGGEWQGGRYNQRSINYYNENNKNSEYQKPIYNVAGGDPYYTVLGYKDGSFIKIRNISLGYNLPKSIVQKLSVQNVKVYAQLKNPGFIYSGVNWLDLDLGGSTYNRGCVFGLNVGF